MEAPKEKPGAKRRVMFFRSAAAMAEANWAASAAQTPAERWRFMFEISRRVFGEWQRALLRHGKREVFFYERQPQESLRAFQARIDNQQREWTFSILRASNSLKR